MQAEMVIREYFRCGDFKGAVGLIRDTQDRKTYERLCDAFDAAWPGLNIRAQLKNAPPRQKRKRTCRRK